jgi:DNA-binding transcriptional LysR family regulator
MLRGHAAAAHDVIEFAVPHTLAFTFFPAWVDQPARTLRPAQEPADRAQRARRRDAPGRRQLRRADRLPPSVAAAAAGHQPLRDGAAGPRGAGAVLQARRRGRTPATGCPGAPASRCRTSGYAPGAYLGGWSTSLIKDSGTAIHLDRVYETDMAESLKAMALEGHGIAFLPQSAVRKEVRGAPAGERAAAGTRRARRPRWRVRAYRERPMAPRRPRRARRRRSGKFLSRRGAAEQAIAPLSYLVRSLSHD